MPAQRVIVFGGYGVFGAHVARALHAEGVPLTIAGRDARRAEAFARALGPDVRAVGADVRDGAACRALLPGMAVAVSCAGPFGALDVALPRACLDAGCHYADIADDRRYIASVGALHAAFRDRGLCAVFGASSLPAISGALALRLLDERPAVPSDRARVTLFIGNRNPKGRAAIASAVSVLGRPIAAPQGMLRGFGSGERVPLPAPFGRRIVYDFESPDYDLLPPLLSVGSISVKVGFELRAATAAFAWLARFGPGYGPRTVSVLSALSTLAARIGCSGGAVMVELLSKEGGARRASISCAHDGQRMAALPCALVALRLARGPVQNAGAMTAYELLGHSPLLDALESAGFTLALA